MGKPRADLTKAASLAAELEDDELISQFGAADDPSGSLPRASRRCATLTPATLRSRSIVSVPARPPRCAASSPRSSASNERCSLFHTPRKKSHYEGKRCAETMFRLPTATQFADQLAAYSGKAVTAFAVSGISLQFISEHSDALLCPASAEGQHPLSSVLHRV
jgi:hypothetical protein